MGKRQGRNDRDYAEAILKPLVDSAFRRPATEEQLGKYLDLVLTAFIRIARSIRTARTATASKTVCISPCGLCCVPRIFSIVANGRGNLMIMIWPQDYPSF